MKNAGNTQLVNHVVSPYGLAIISYALFLSSCLIPPPIYSHYIDEPDLMFLDPATILFYTLCVVSFMVGVWLIGKIFPPALGKNKASVRSSSMPFILIPLLFGIVLAIGAISYTLTRFPDFILLLLMQQGEGIKDSLATGEGLGGIVVWIPLLVTGVTWWGFWRYSDLDLRGWRKRLIQVALSVSVLIVIALSVIALSRSVVMMILSGLAIQYVVRKTLDGQMTVQFVVKCGVFSACCASLFFIGFAALRGTINFDDQVAALVGYSVASYNRLAAILNGNLRYPFAGHGIYLSDVIAHNRLLPFSKFNPDTLSVWASEFGAVTSAGLDGRLIWSGAFGYIFSDLGWFSFPFIFGYGLLYGHVWNRCKGGNIIGIVLYPWFGFCVFFWMGTNYLLGQPTEVFLFLAIMLAVYEHAFIKRSRYAAYTGRFNTSRRSLAGPDVQM